MQQPLNLAERVRMLNAAPSSTHCSISQQLVATCHLHPRIFKPSHRGSLHLSSARSARQAVLAAAAVQHRGKSAGLPKVDWTRYHLQVLFVDNTDTVRARVAAGLFERIAEWNGFGRALYPWSCGLNAAKSKPADLSTTASLFSQASFLGIRAKLFAAPPEQLTLQDLDRHDVIAALDAGIKDGILRMVQPEWHAYYDAKVCVLDQFSGYMGEDILKKGGSALLESELSEIIRPAVSEGSARPDVLRPSLHKGAEEWNPMVQAIIISCAGLVQYLIDAYPPDLPHYDPQ